jgi:excisionase family DNA binding protein
MNHGNCSKSQQVPTGDLFVDPRAFGLVKAAYTVTETLEILSIGRTSLYAVVKRGHLHPVKFGRKTLFYAIELASFLKVLQGRGS